MKIFKALTSDIVLFIINFVVLVFIWFNFFNHNSNIFIEVFFIGVLYYLVSLLTSFIVVFLLYLKIKSIFEIDINKSLFYRLEIVSHIFSEYFDEIHEIKDFELKFQEIY